jgi:hypothetical protein
MLHNHQICNQGLINKESTCEKSPKPASIIIQSRRSETPPGQRPPMSRRRSSMKVYLPHVNGKAPMDQQQISINVMKITMWNLIQYEV